MAKRQFVLTQQEISELKRAEAQTRKVRELKRLQAVRMYGEGCATREVEEVTGSSWRALMDWARRYRAEGVSGLMSRYEGQNAAKLTRQQRTELSQKLRQYRPDQVIAPEMRMTQAQFWTVSDLRIVVEQWYGVTYHSQNSYRNLLHISQFSLQQPESRYRSRPDDLTVADFEAKLEKK